MSKIKNDALDQYGAEPFEQQQYGTAGVEGVNRYNYVSMCLFSDISFLRYNSKRADRQTDEVQLLMWPSSRRAA